MKRNLNNILALILITTFASCGVNNKSIKYKRLIKSDASMEILQQYKKSSWLVKEELAKNSWPYLKKLYANDLLSAEELGIVDCSGFDRNSIKLRMLSEVEYNILYGIFSWRTYQSKDGLCIELESFEIRKPKSTVKFLNLEDSRILLSASKGYLFAEHKLTPPEIYLKRTLFWTIVGTPCGSSRTKFSDGKMITSNACEESIYYKYNN